MGPKSTERLNAVLAPYDRPGMPGLVATVGRMTGFRIYTSGMKGIPFVRVC